MCRRGRGWIDPLVTAIVAGPKHPDWQHIESLLLPEKERHGWELTIPVMLMKGGNRDLLRLTDTVDPSSASVVQVLWERVRDKENPHEAKPEADTAPAKPKPALSEDLAAPTATSPPRLRRSESAVEREAREDTHSGVDIAPDLARDRFDVIVMARGIVAPDPPTKISVNVNTKLPELERRIGQGQFANRLGIGGSPTLQRLEGNEGGLLTDANLQRALVRARFRPGYVIFAVFDRF